MQLVSQRSSGPLDADSAAPIKIGPDGPVWNASREALWLRIQAHDFEPDTPLNFTMRLARDHGWPMAEARAAVEAYRRFCFLAAVCMTPVTPSEIVDEVWHQHLVYSRDYWETWCGKALKSALHHDPTPGGPEAQGGYRRQYADTLALHEDFFGPPPDGIWPATHLRFAGPSYSMVDRRSSLVLPNPLSYIRRFFKKEYR